MIEILEGLVGDKLLQRCISINRIGRNQVFRPFLCLKCATIMAVTNNDSASMMMSRHKKKNSFPRPTKTLKMKDDHTWDAPKGYKIVVADKGAVSFNIPRTWVIAKL